MDGLSLILSGCKFHSRTEDGMKELYYSEVRVRTTGRAEALRVL